ncbi:MAG: glycosyltransferase family 2 protein [Candidatus Hodarchaeota archaeon]
MVADSNDKYLPDFSLSSPRGNLNKLFHSNRVEGGLRVRTKLQRKSQPGKPLVSIITAVRNDEEHLERSIQSVINQSYDNIEYIIIDGASTDGTVDIIKKYEDFIDYWVSEPDRGVYDAMNKGVRCASGDWLYFLGCDDILLNNLTYIASNFKDRDTIYYGDVYLPKLHKMYDGRFSAYKLMVRNICHQSIFYPKRIFEKYSYDQKYKIWADYVLNMKCHGDKDFNFVHIPNLVAIYNNESGISWDRVDSEVEKDKKQIVRTNFSKELFLIFCIRSALVKLLEKLSLKEILKSIMNRQIR